MSLTVRSATTDDQEAINAWWATNYQADPAWVCSPPSPHPSTVELGGYFADAQNYQVYVALDADSVRGTCIWRTTDGLVAWLNVPHDDPTTGGTVTTALLDAVAAEGVTPHGTVAVDATRSALLSVPGMTSQSGNDIRWG